MNSVCAVLVSLNPDIEILRATIEATFSQVNKLLIVDNNSDNDIFSKLYPLSLKYSAKVIKSSKNNGLAKGQNIGICWALENGYKYVLILDQDSIPYPNMVKNLLNAHDNLKNKNISIAAVGPVYINPSTGNHSYFVRFNKLGLNRIYCTDIAFNEYILCDFLISSGALISAETIRQVGLMQEDLFIDHIDTEWFVRAKQKGFSAYGVCRAFMQHSIGDKSIKIWLGRKKEIGRHSPERLYYNIRNSLILLKKKHFSKRISFILLTRSLNLFIFYLLFIPPRYKYFKYGYRGIKDALSGKTDKIG